MFNSEGFDQITLKVDSEIVEAFLDARGAVVKGGLHTYLAKPKDQRAIEKGLTILRINNIPKNMKFFNANASEVTSGTTTFSVGSARVLTLGSNYDENENFVQVYVYNTFENPIHCALQVLMIT